MLFARRLGLAVLGLFVSVGPAFADEARPAAPVTFEQPDLISLGLGSFDMRSRVPNAATEDFRLEYRFGTSLLPKIYHGLSFLDAYVQMHPMLGVEVTGDRAAYGFGGFVFDVPVGKNLVFSPNVVVGYYDRGDGKVLGSKIEFRSTIEAGIRLDNDMRITGYFGHISNAGITEKNPGAEMAGVYLHLPFRH